MKTKIVFAGVMGAILMSVGANAATTSVATKGYVDQEIKGVNTTITNLDSKYATPNSVTNAINNAVNDLNLGGTYEVLVNKVNSLSETMSEEEKTTKYPSVKAVLDAMPVLTDEDKKAIADLTGDNGLITRVGKVETAVDTLKGDGEGSVAKSIANAIEQHTTAADAKYQAQSTADFSIGTTGGKFRVMSDAEQKALASGITVDKVADYDALAGETGTVAELQKAINDMNGENGTIAGLRTDVAANTSAIATNKTAIETNKTDIATNASAIATNKTDIATNKAEIAKKLDIPAACQSGNETCVLMTSNGTVSWTPVTSPVNDPETTGGSEAGES